MPKLPKLDKIKKSLSFLDAPVADFQSTGWVKTPGDRPGTYKMTTLREILKPDLEFFEDIPGMRAYTLKNINKRLLNEASGRPIVPGHLAEDRLKYEMDRANAIRQSNQKAYGLKSNPTKEAEADKWFIENEAGLYPWKR